MPVDFHRLNGLVGFVLRTPVVHWLLSPGLGLLTVTGARSGRGFSFPVGYQQIGGRVVVLVSQADTKTWWRNYRLPGPATIRIRGHDVRGTAIVIDPESDEFAGHIESTLRRMPYLDRQFGIDFDKGSGLGSDDLRYLAEHAAVVEITPVR